MAFQVDHIPTLSEAADEVRAEVEQRLDGISDPAIPTAGVQHLADARRALIALLSENRAESICKMIVEKVEVVAPDVAEIAPASLIFAVGHLADRIAEAVAARMQP